MNAYDEALYNVLEQMLAAKGCDLDKDMLRRTLVDKFQNKMYEVGTRITKEYETVRECHAENQLSAKRALNRFYLSCEPHLSLTGAETKEESFKVLTQNPGKQLACLSALMPRSEIFEKDIYEANEEITQPALNNPFLMEPKMPIQR